MARLVRGQVLSLRGAEFVIASRVVGVSGSRLVARHVLPNIVGPLSVAATFGVASAILLEAGISFLGLASNHRPREPRHDDQRRARSPTVLQGLPWDVGSGRTDDRSHRARGELRRGRPARRPRSSRQPGLLIGTPAAAAGGFSHPALEGLVAGRRTLQTRVSLAIRAWTGGARRIQGDFATPNSPDSAEWCRIVLAPLLPAAAGMAG